ncbi:hypothetical protein BGZ99_002735 [Dissophora globulifera]|uniref:Uncharacterized protein n=1 Tax=Dissophora globulifera TaxID=979702 RepID=A0A9P6RQ64_9FUNG|nr:hypothetical protein BGZ99_002735 [Dissophora globulifera]
MDFTGRVDLSLVLDLVQELRDFCCRYRYSWEKSNNNHQPNLSKNRWRYKGGEYSQGELIYYSSLDDSESEASDDMCGSDDDRLDGTESMASSDMHKENYNVIRKVWDDDAYLDDDQFKNTYHSIENIIKLRKGTDKLGIIKVITGLDRECTKPCDYFYGIAGLLGMKLEPGKNVKELFEIFMKNLVLMDENLAVEEPEWTRQEGQDWTTEMNFYSHIVVKDLKVVKKEGTEAPRTIIWVKKHHEVPADLAGDYYKNICSDIKFLSSIEHPSYSPNDSVLNTAVEEWSDEFSSEFSDEYPLEERVTTSVRDTKQLLSDAGDLKDKIDANDSVPSTTDDEDYDEDSLEERNTAAVHDTKQPLNNAGDLKDELTANDSVLSKTDDDYDEDYDGDYDEDYDEYYGEFYDVFSSEERISAAIHGTEQPLSTTATIPKALHNGGPEDATHTIARQSKETEDPTEAMISTLREVVNHVEMDMDVNDTLRRNVISDLMRHRWAENCLCKDAKCDEKCEIILRLVPKLEYGSYIYFFRDVVILSKVFIDDKFELLDVGISKVEDEDTELAMEKIMCRLGVDD